MHTQEYYKHFDIIEELEGYEQLPSIRHMAYRNRRRGAKKFNLEDERAIQEEMKQVNEQLAEHETLKMSYKAAIFEEGWLRESLDGFLDERWLEDVVRLVKGGKEASVYLCTSGKAAQIPQRWVAAKVYRPRSMRNLRNDSLYREGRSDLDIEGHEVLDERMQRAMRQKSLYGKELLHTSWIGHEFKTMQILHAAGVDIPTPYVSAGNAILMDYIGDHDLPAPALSEVELDRDEAKFLFERVLFNIDRMLAQHRVHGDLSAYNILYWEGQISLIDFPQAIDPEANRNAYRIFARDVARICEYFTRQGVSSNARRLASDLWTAYGYPLQAEFDPRLLKDEDEAEMGGLGELGSAVRARRK